MAVDTREKRMAMLGFGGGHNWDTLFEADNAVDQDDRAHMLDLYSGFGSTGVSGGGSVTGITDITNVTGIT